MSMQRLLFSTLLAILTAFSSLAQANIVGQDVQNFNTITSGIDFVTVHSSETLDPCLINLGLFLNYAQNSFSYLEFATSDSRKFQDSLFMADLNFGLGLTKNWDVGMSFPYLISEQDNSASQRSILVVNSGFTEYRFNTKYRFFGDRSGGLAAVASVNFGNIQNDPFTGNNAGPTFNLELAADTTLNKKFAIGGNIGYRFRKPGDRITTFPIYPYGNQIIASVAGSYLLPKSDVKLISEIYGAMPSTSSGDAKTDSAGKALEWIFGAKVDISQSVALHLGGGTRLLNNAASPDWRVYTGINWVIGPICDEKSKKLEFKAPKPPQVWLPEEEETGETVNVANYVEVSISADILFQFNSDHLIENVTEVKNALKNFADQSNPQHSLKKAVIEGHTDSIGSDSYNLSLSQRRANSIKRYLVKNHGLDPQKLEPIGYGESRPIADNGNYQGRRLNRRVEFKIYKKGSF